MHDSNCAYPQFELWISTTPLNPRLTRGGGWLPPPLCIYAIMFFARRNFEIRFRKPIKHSFSHLLVKNCENGLLKSKVISGLPCGPRGMVSTPSPSISACKWDRNEIPTATPMFSGSSNSMEVISMLCNQTGSRKSNMAVTKTGST
jgi:hypothetical protein